MKEELIELYKDALRLGHYIELENVANGMLPTLYPGSTLDNLSDEELVALTKSVIKVMISWVC